jgi:diketogulonate reductase-like aldo/keto reductase
MNIPEKTLSDGFSIPVYGLGTWQMGGRWGGDSHNDERDLEAIITAVELGIRHIDTAEIYAAGKAEILVGRAIKKVGRENVFIASKAGYSHSRPDDVIKACHQSLDRLETDYLDLYMPHGHDDRVPLGETMSAFDQLVDDGLVRNVGLSNFITETLREAQSVTRTPIRIDQVHYNVAHREPESTGLIDYCQKSNVVLNAWRPVQKGDVAGIGDLHSLPDPTIAEMAEKYNKTAAQICINWLISQQNVITMAKTSNVDHLKENLGAVDWKMEESDIEYIRKRYKNQTTLSDVPLN